MGNNLCTGKGGKGEEVRVIPRNICEFYNALYYENDFVEEINLKYFKDINMNNVINYLIEGTGE